MTSSFSEFFAVRGLVVRAAGCALLGAFALVACSGEKSPEPPRGVDMSEMELAQGTAGDARDAEVVAGYPAVLFLGTSLSAGYGIDPALAFPGLIEDRIEEADLPFRVVNAGTSGDTSATGLSRLSWLLQSEVAVLVLELGGNDGLQGRDVSMLERNLREIVRKTREHSPDGDVVLAGMQAPPNMGPDYCNAFAAVYPRLADELELALVPFLLEGVGGEAELNLADGIHPTPAGHEIVADSVWAVLEPVLRERSARD